MELYAFNLETGVNQRESYPGIQTQSKLSRMSLCLY